jgi:uncharacterized protein YegJ (DUF2314 family)
VLRVVLCAAVALTACRPPAPPTKPQARPRHVAGTPVARGSLVEGRFHSGYAIILPPGADADAGLRAAREAAKARGLDVQPLGSMPPGRIAVIGVQSFEAPEPDVLANSARGIAEPDLAILRKATQQILIGTASDDRAQALHDGAELARTTARATRGWIGDLPTEMFYGRPLFDILRPVDFALSSETITMVLFEEDDDGTLTLTTLGLGQVGLPELVISGVPFDAEDDLLFMVNAASQTLIDAGTVTRDGELTVDLATLRAGRWPEHAASVERDGGSGVATWKATWAETPEGAAPRIVLAPAGDGPMAVRFFAARAAMFGAENDAMTYTYDEDPEMDAARERARAELLLLDTHFAGGIPAGERLLVKAPFTTGDEDGTREWMWVEVARWQGPSMTGTLINEPADTSALAAGDRVDVLVGELFDYIHYRADGSRVGGYSDEVMERRARGE